MFKYFSMPQKLNLIIGDPVEHSLSPKIHNFVYAEFGLANKYLFERQKVETTNLSKFIQKVRSENINGLAVTIPHKQKIMEFLDEIDPVAKKIGSVNTVVNKNGCLIGYNTDWLGTLFPIYESLTEINLSSSFPKIETFRDSLKDQFDFSKIKVKNNQQTKKLTLEEIQDSQFLKDQSVLLIGAGGAARGMAYAVLAAGADLLIQNRTKTKAEELRGDLWQIFPKSQIEVVDLEYFQILFQSNFQLKNKLNFFLGQATSSETFNPQGKFLPKIIINSTSIGMGKLKDKLPIHENLINSEQILFDAVYSPLETKFIQVGKQKEAQIISGLEMLIWQAYFQMELHLYPSARANLLQKALGF